LSIAVDAQSSIVNAPSSEVAARKELYLEMDFITNYAWERKDNSFQNYLPRAVVGLGRNLEAGLNVSYTRVPGGGAPLELQPNVKWQFYNNEEKGISAAVGCLWFVPVTNRVDTDTLGQCYSVMSKQFPGNFGPRFTGGGYVLIGSGPAERSKFGAIVGYEQPLNKKMGFIIDWSSGNNRLGYVNPGFYFVTPGNGSLSAGYSFSNYGRGRNALFAYYGMSF
jgi:hypothetical protein